jgi:two-component system, cell cycle sensor histidine kinase and response regulator CckA
MKDKSSSKPTLDQELQSCQQKIIQLETALGLLEAETNAIRHFILIGSWTWEKESDTTFWSDEMYRIFCRDPKQPIPPFHETYKLFRPESWKKLESAIEKTIVTGVPYEVDAEIVRPDGSKRWIVSRGDVERTPGGKIVLLRGTCQDITERKIAEAALREAEERNRALFESTLNLVYVHDLQGNFIDANKAALELFGYTKEEIGKITFASLLDPVELPKAVELTEEILRLGFQKSPEVFNVKRKNGGYLCIEIQASLIYRGGNPVAILGIGRDLTEQKRAEEALRKSESLYHSLFDNMLEGYAFCRMIYANNEPVDFIYLDVNQSFEELTGLKNVVGSKVSEVIPGFRKSEKELLEIYSRVALTGKPDRFEFYVDALNDWYDLSVFSPQKEHFVAVFDVITKRKRSEEKLSRLNQAVQASEEVILMADDEGVITFINPAFTRLYGYEPDEVIGKVTPRILDSGTENEDLHEQFWRTLLEKRVFRGEFLNRSKDGRLIPVEIAASPIMDPEGNVTGFLAVERDISKRKQSEKALQESEVRFKQVAESAGEWIWEVDANGLYTFSSPVVEKILGYRPEEIVGKKYFYDLFAPDVRDELREGAFKAIGRKEHIRDFVNPNVHKNGKRAILMTNGVPILDSHGSLLGYRGADIDITERRKAEEALEETKEYLGNIINAIADPVFVKDKDHRFVMVNDAQCAAVGKSREELVGRTDSEFFPAEEVEIFWQNDDRVLKTGEENISRELMTDAHGNVRVLVTKKTLYTDKSGRKYIVGVVRDVGERERAEEELVKLNKAVEASGEVIFMTDRNGVFTFVNNSFTHLYGYQPEEVMGKTTPKIIKSGAQTPDVYREFWSTLSEKKIFNGEFVNRTKDGRNVTVEASANPILDSSGNIIGFLAVQRDVTGRKQAEQMITDALSFNRTLLNSSSIGIIAFDETGEVKSVNEAAAKIIGGTREQVLTQNFHKLQAWKDSGLYDTATRVLMTGVGELIEASGPTSFGKRSWFSCRFEPFIHSGKKQLLLFISDVSDRKRSEQRLTMQYRISRILSESTTIEVATPKILKSVIDTFSWEVGELWLIDASVNALRCVEMVKAQDFDAREFEDVSRQMIFPSGIGLPGEIWAERRPKWDRDSSNLSNRPRTAIAQKIGLHSAIGFPILSGNQMLGVFMFNSSRVLEPDTEILQVFSTIGMQIGEFIEHKRADEDVKRNEEKYRTLFEESRDTIFIAEPDGRLIDVNPAGLRLFGYDAADDSSDFHLGRDLYWNPNDRELYLSIIRQRGHVQDYELDMRSKDGKKVVVLINAKAVHDGHGNITMIRGTLRNVTAQKQLEEQFIQVQKLEGIGTLAGGIAHDFNNILGIIMGYLGLLESGNPSPELLKNSLEVMNTAVNRGTNLVKQILTFARQTEILRGPLDVNVMIKEFIKMIKETFPKTITIDFDLDIQLPLILADPTQFHQILLNICVNSRDAMPRGGMMFFKTEKTAGSALRMIVPEAGADAYLHLRIADTGVGMNKEVKDRVFEPFFTTKEKGKGTGLGLATVYGIVKNHNGFIYIDSEPGKGSVFQLFFPLPTKMDETTYTFKPQAEIIAGKNETVFLIEDEELLVELVKSLLEGHNYRVLVAKDGEEAISVYRDNIEKIDLVLTDMDLPKYSGEQIFAIFRELNPDIKLIFASGFIEPEVKTEMFNRGARSFIEKPYRPAELLKSIRDVLDKKQ